MTRAPSFAGLILAAGASTRMGRDKALLPWPPRSLSGTFLSAAMDSLAPSCDFTLVVAGTNIESLRPIVDARSGFIVQNIEPARGQFSSLRVGLQEVLNRGWDGAIITLVDRPAAERETVMALKQHFLRGLGRGGEELWSVVPEYAGRHGHPFVIGREMMEAFLRAPGSSTAREVEHAHQAHIGYFAVADPNVIANVDTREDYEALTEYKALPGAAN